MIPLLAKPLVRLIDTGTTDPDSVVWVNVTGIQITSEFAATQFLNCNTLGKSSMYSPIGGRDRLITVEHKLIAHKKELRYQAIVRAIAGYAAGSKIILVGLSLGGYEAAGIYRWIMEHCPDQFSAVALVLISTPGKFTDLQPAMQKHVKRVHDHPATLGRAAHLSARYLPGLYLSRPVREELRTNLMLKHAALASISESSAWLLPAVQRLAEMDGLGPRMERPGPVFMANLDPDADDAIDVARSKESVRATFGDNVPSFDLQARWHGTPWLHPWYYQRLLEILVRPHVMAAFGQI
jgi:pimeloyl-ACP methyl ester carboxylesterase